MTRSQPGYQQQAPASDDVCAIFKPCLTSNQWLVTSEMMVKSNQQFSALDADKDGYVSGREGFHFFKQSGISPEILATIWELADVSKDGVLDARVRRGKKSNAEEIRNFVWLSIWYLPFFQAAKSLDLCPLLSSLPSGMPF